MKGLIVVAIAATLGACGAKKDRDKQDGSGGGSATAVTKPADTTKTCPAGSALKDGACIVVITPEKLEVVAKQQTRLDELAKILDKADLIGAPIELLDAFRQLDVWKQLLVAYPKLKAVDEAIGTMREGIKQLHVLRDGLAAAAVGLGDLKGSLDKVLHDQGVSRQVDDLTKQVSTQLKATLEPLEAQVTQTIQKVLVPITAQISDIADMVLGTCAMAKMTGGSDKMKELCGQAKDVFTRATTYLEDLKTRPGVLFGELTKQLITALTLLVDTTSRQALDAAQAKVNEALKLPAATGSGSAATP